MGLTEDFHPKDQGLHPFCDQESKSDYICVSKLT